MNPVRVCVRVFSLQSVIAFRRTLLNFAQSVMQPSAIKKLPFCATVII